MSYKCSLTPPHIDGEGNRMAHKSRKECLSMGLANRGTETHPEKYDSGATVTPNYSSAVAAGPTPEQATASAPTAPAEDYVTASKGGPSATSSKKKFSIFKRSDNSPAEGSPEQKKEIEAPRFVLSGELTVRFWTTVASFGKSAVEFVDSTIHSKKPFDTSVMDFTASEEEMIAEVMPEMTTKIVKGMGAKSLESASRIINGLVIIRVFGRIFGGLALHFAEELKTRGKEKRVREVSSKKAAEGYATASKGGALPPKASASEAVVAEAPPETASAPEAPRFNPHPSPAQMEKENDIMKTIMANEARFEAERQARREGNSLLHS